MSLLRQAIAGAIQFRADITGAPAPWDDFWYSPIGSASSTGMRITPDTAKRISSVLACVSLIGRNIAVFPLKLYRENADGGKSVEKKHPLSQVLYARPNDLQTSFEFRQMMQGHVELRGNAYAEILPGSRGAVTQLVPMHPDRVTVEVLRSGRPRYRYNDPLTADTRYLVAEEVFHLRNWSDDGYTGQSTVAMGVDTFGIALSAQDYAARFFKNDGRPSVVLSGGKFKSKEDEDAFRENWRQSQTGANRHLAAMLPPGMDIKTLGITAADAQLLDSRKFSRIEVCSMFGVPPHLIGETEKTATYASVEQFNIMFAVQCILPRLVMWEQTISRSLLGNNDSIFPKFSMAALLRGDTASRFAAYKVAIENGWMCQDDVRLLEDLNPIPGGIGSKFWRPANWAPLEQTVTPASPNQLGDGSTVDPQDPGAGSSPENALLRDRVKLLATCAAEPCVRKEVNALRRLADRSAGADEFRAAAVDFYREHAVFLAERMRIPMKVAREYCDRNVAWTAQAHDAAELGNLNFDILLAQGMQWLGARAAEVVQ